MLTNDNIPQIQVVGEYEFDFFGTSIWLVKSEESQLYAALISLCNIFGLNELKETARIKQHSILKTKLVKAPVRGIPSLRCLSVGSIATWLLNLSIEAIPDEEGQKDLASFQMNASQILEEAFCAGQLMNEGLLAELLEFDSPYRKIYRESLAVTCLARQHLMGEAKSDVFFHQYSKIEKP